MIIHSSPPNPPAEFLHEPRRGVFLFLSSVPRAEKLPVLSQDDDIPESVCVNLEKAEWGGVKRQTR